jgi:flavin-dependent dehydrogenase
MQSDEVVDVVVVGARCAGAATAMLMARAGLRVLNVDRSPAGTDTLSTHALMRGGVLQFKRWGLLQALERLQAPRITQTVFYYGDERVPVTIKPKHGVDALYAPRRTAIDAMIVDAARRAGARVEHRTSLVGVTTNETGRVTGVRLRRADGATRVVRASLVVGADGASSRLAKLVGARETALSTNASCTLYRYAPGLGLDGYHWHFADGASAGAIPTGDGATCVFVSTHHHRFRELTREGIDTAFERLLRRTAPELAARMARPAREGRLYAFAGRAGFMRQSVGPGWALVGDAGYFKDPGTSHGMTDALRDAELLTRSFTTPGASLSDYPTERDRWSERLSELSDQISSFRWSFAELKQWHVELSQQMNLTADAIAAWDPGEQPLRQSRSNATLPRLLATQRANALPTLPEVAIEHRAGVPSSR